MYDPEQLRRFTLTEYHKLLEHGILNADDRAELLEGHLICHDPHSPAVCGVMDLLDREFATRLPESWFQRSRRAITLADLEPHSEPEPDYSIVRGPRRRYQENRPGPAEVGLVVELAEQLLPVVRGDMGRIYARAAIPMFWVINVPDRVVEMYSNPSGPIDRPHYAKRDVYPVGTAVPVVLDGQTVGTIPVADVMG